MNKKKTIIIALVLIFALLIGAIALTFPTYLFEDIKIKKANEKYSQAASDKAPHTGPEEQGPDIGYVGDSPEAGPSIEAVLPTIDDDSNSSSTDLTDEQLGQYTVTKLDSAVLKAENNAFADDAKVTFKKLGIFSKKYYRARHYIRSFYNRFVAYDYEATRDGKSYNPQGKVTIIIDIPEKYDLDKTSVYYLFDNSVQELDCTIDKENRTISAPVTLNGVYVLVESKSKSNDDSSENTSSDDSTSSNISSDTSSTPSGDSSTPSQDNDNTSSDTPSGDNSSDASNDTSSSTPIPPADKDSMEGYSPWQ